MMQLPDDFSQASQVHSVVTDPETLMSTPDGRYFLWTSRQRGDDVLRMVWASPWGPSMSSYFLYRLPTPFATPTFDPSGEWMYVPAPDRDSILVYQ